MFQAMWCAFKSYRSNTPMEKVLVDYDNNAVWVQASEPSKRVLIWASIGSIGVKTTDQEPCVDDVFWHISANDTTLSCPASAQGAEKMLARFREFPGFDNERVILAMSYSDNALFLPWEKKARHDDQS